MVYCCGYWLIFVCGVDECDVGFVVIEVVYCDDFMGWYVWVGLYCV